MHTKKTIFSFLLLFTAVSACFALEPADFKRSSYALMTYSNEWVDIPAGSDPRAVSFINQYGFRQLELYNGIVWDKYYLIDGFADYALISFDSLRYGDIDFSYKTLDQYKKGSTIFLNERRLSFAKNQTCSSFLQEGGYSYRPENVFIPCKHEWALPWVQNLPWVEGKADEGIGEWIQFDIQDPNEWKDIIFDLIIDGDVTVSILNGYVHPEKQYLFYDNNRIKKATVYLDGVESFDIDFPDRVEFTEFTIPNTVKTVRLVIKEVYRGAKYNDTCITKIDVDYKTCNDPNSAKNSEL